MNRRHFVQLTSLATAQILGAGCAHRNGGGAFAIQEATLMELQAAMQSGRESALSLTQRYLHRIAEIDQRGPTLNSIIELNPEAMAIARGLDAERKAHGPRGPLHGLPVLIKDNLATHDRMMTTAGSLALVGSVPPDDSTVARKLREAGVVILGKTNLSEWANFRGNRSTSGWSGRGGQTRNPYALDRNPSGSSSGSAVSVSASLCAFAIGTETDGSIVSPASHCGIVGLKPTVGLISRAGIIPISQSQDTAGPMTRTVADAATVIGALLGVDERDAATESSRGHGHPDYTQFLDRNGLRGARIGIARKFFGSNTRANRMLETAIAALKRAGAEIIDPTDLSTLAQFGGPEHELMLYEFKAGVNAYLASLGPSSPVHSLQEIIEFNQRNKERELPFFGQETLSKAQEKGPLTEPAYLEAVATARRLAGREGIDALMDQHRLDAIAAPTAGPAGMIDPVYGDRGEGGSSSPAAVAGYPNITVPAGNVLGLPIGISFFGRAFSEPTLLRIAFAFEQATQARRPPRFLRNTDKPS